MKPFATRVLVFCICIAVLPACKKEAREPAVRADALSAGRAAIKFTASKSINGSREFNVNNTADTKATNQSLNAGNVRNVILETTERNETTPTRKVLINMALRENTTPGINLSLISGLPLCFIDIDSYSLFGYMRHSVSGTVTITHFTTTEIEGRFTATFDDGTTIENGIFAGKF